MQHVGRAGEAGLTWRRLRRDPGFMSPRSQPGRSRVTAHRERGAPLAPAQAFPQENQLDSQPLLIFGTDGAIVHPALRFVLTFKRRGSLFGDIGSTAAGSFMVHISSG